MSDKIPESADQLIIKKAAEKSVVFHYDRAERLALKRAAAPAPCKKKGIFRRNSPLVTIILNVIILVIILTGVRFFSNREKPAGTVAGYAVQLYAFKVETAVYAFVSFEKKAPQAADLSGTAEVIFKLQKSGTETSQVVDLSAAGKRELKVTMPLAANDQTVEARVTIGAGTSLLFKKIDK